MEKINCSRMSEFSNTLRKYYDLGDIRISDVHLYNSNDIHIYHRHTKITEVLFVIDGQIKVKIKDNDKIKESIINSNEIVRFNTNELHTVSAINKARVLVLKYLKHNENILDIIINDFEEA